MEGAEAWVGAGDLMEGGDEVTACLERLGVGGKRHGWRIFGGRIGLTLVEVGQGTRKWAL